MIKMLSDQNIHWEDDVADSFNIIDIIIIFIIFINITTIVPTESVINLVAKISSTQQHILHPECLHYFECPNTNLIFVENSRNRKILKLKKIPFSNTISI